MPPIGTILLAIGLVVGLGVVACAPRILMRIAYAPQYAALSEMKKHFGVRVSPWRRLRYEMQHSGAIKGTLGLAFAFTGWPTVFMTTMKVPANSTWCGGLPREWCTHTFKVKTTTNLRSGRGVVKDTTDEEIKLQAADATDTIGWLGTKNYTNPTWDPTTAPAAADEVEVILQFPGVVVRVRNGANLAMGALANVGATAIKAAAAGAGQSLRVVGRVLHDSDGSGTEADALMVVSL